MEESYYQVLGVSPDASREEIRRAFRALALQLHPDKLCGADVCQFQKINVAYECLSDDIRRSIYDSDNRKEVCLTDPNGETAIPVAFAGSAARLASAKKCSEDWDSNFMFRRGSIQRKTSASFFRGNRRQTRVEVELLMKEQNDHYSTEKPRLVKPKTNKLPSLPPPRRQLLLRHQIMAQNGEVHRRPGTSNSLRPPVRPQPPASSIVDLGRKNNFAAERTQQIFFQEEKESPSAFPLPIPSSYVVRPSSSQQILRKGLSIQHHGPASRVLR